MDASRTDYRRCASAVHGAKPIRVIESESVLNILSFDQRLAAEVGVLRAWTAIVRPIAPHTIFNILGYPHCGEHRTGQGLCERKM